MYRIATALVTFLLLLGSARGADDPRALLERALRASGDAGGAKAPLAAHVRTKGTVSVKEAPPAAREITMALELHIQSIERLRMKMDLTVPGMKMNDSALIILDGKKGWRSTGNSPTQELSNRDTAEIRSLTFLERFADFQALLHDKRFTFTALGESRVGGRAVLGVKVSCKGQDDFSLFFDKTTGLLSQASYSDRSVARGRPGKIEITYQDYQEVDTGADESALLTKAGLETTGPALIDLLRKQSPPRDAQERAKKLVRQLGDEDFSVREKASKELVRLGAVAARALEEASRSDDAEVRRRARSCLKQLKAGADEKATIAAVHLLALRRPAGAADALLDILPTAPESVAGAIRAALYHLGSGSSKPDAVLVAALKDPTPARRAAAEAALGKDGDAYAKLPNRRIFRPDAKRPRKIILLLEHNAQLTLEVQEQRFYNRFDDSLFAQPTPNKR